VSPLKIKIPSKYIREKPTNTTINYSVLPGKPFPSRFHSKGPYGDSYPYTWHLLHISLIPHKNVPK
jgi:hypothetical protein